MSCEHDCFGIDLSNLDLEGLLREAVKKKAAKEKEEAERPVSAEEQLAKRRAILVDALKKRKVNPANSFRENVEKMLEDGRFAMQMEREICYGQKFPTIPVNQEWAADVVVEVFTAHGFTALKRKCPTDSQDIHVEIVNCKQWAEDNLK